MLLNAQRFKGGEWCLLCGRRELLQAGWGGTEEDLIEEVALEALVHLAEARRGTRRWWRTSKGTGLAGRAGCHVCSASLGEPLIQGRSRGVSPGRVGPGLGLFPASGRDSVQNGSLPPSGSVWSR